MPTLGVRPVSAAAAIAGVSAGTGEAQNTEPQIRRSAAAVAVASAAGGVNDRTHVSNAQDVSSSASLPVADGKVINNPSRDQAVSSRDRTRKRRSPAESPFAESPAAGEVEAAGKDEFDNKNKTEETWVCPKCEETVEASKKRCSWCAAWKGGTKTAEAHKGVSRKKGGSADGKKTATKTAGRKESAKAIKKSKNAAGRISESRTQRRARATQKSAKDNKRAKSPETGAWTCHVCQTVNDGSRKRCSPPCLAWSRGKCGITSETAEPSRPEISRRDSSVSSVERRNVSSKSRSVTNVKKSSATKTHGKKGAATKYISIKQRHNVGDKVYACWLPDSKNDSWYSATVKGYKVTGKSKYGDIRSYHVLYEDGDRDKNLGEAFVMTEKEYELLTSENVAFKGVKHQADDGSAKDDYAMRRGWYVIDLLGNAVFSSAGAAARARDDALVQRDGKKTNKLQLNFPDEWRFSKSEAPARLVSGDKSTRSSDEGNENDKKCRTTNHDGVSLKPGKHLNTRPIPEDDSADIDWMMKQLNELHREHKKEVAEFAKEQQQWLKRVEEEGRRMREEHLAKCREYFSKCEQLSKRIRRN